MTLSRPKRLENIRGAFKMGKSLPVKASTVLLVDDVMTTGATILEAAKVLKGGGIGKVIPVVLARTP
jgi:predicted amidophosphoribosyltransferase